MATELDIAAYATVPSVNVPQAVALGIALVSALPSAAPSAMPPAVTEKATALRSRVLALQSAWGTREGQVKGSAVNEDAREDRAWGALRKAVEASENLGATPRGVAAQEVRQKLFPEGLGFLRLRQTEQWAETERRLQRVEDEGLEMAIHKASGGPEFLNELVAAHVEYGKALNITQAAPGEADVNLRDALRDVRDAIAAYALQVVAWSQQANANVPPARNALRPIDEQRAAEASRNSGTKVPEPTVTPQTPVPAV
jgi:hypothetical protein